jgi:hypothetical protein
MKGFVAMDMDMDMHVTDSLTGVELFNTWILCIVSC